MRPSRILAAGLGAFALVGLVAVGLGTGSSAYAADDVPPTGVNLQVTVVPGSGGTSSPSPAANTPNRTTTTTEGGSTVTSGPVSAPALGDDEYSIGGILYVSGLNTEYRPSIDPLGGELSAQFTVRNVSSSIIDSTARFWVTGPFGNELGSVDGVAVNGLKPNEKVVVQSTLTGVGQWTFATAHYTLTPPATVDGVALEPMTRDTFVFLPPWFLLALAAVAGVAYVIVRIVRDGSASVAPAGVGAAATQESTA
ncbi:hypothetical protein [Herbiconiux ginsengi]|uniref:DUF916 domain-containing protein n=1 Tax=Herbiconiux ginsengi TaxID=381665 RepID=A0A1H3QKD3_9MICO|nr:hypothetical protein [Herbiconiux ginsengi]SDZ13561.1 hypothetical protein SAMN05216554_2573 [Herbiconiux ginsengi]